MAYEFYVTVEGGRQGKFAQETQQGEHAGKIPGVSFRYGVKTNREAASGMATGRRSHQPVSFVKEWGASTPQFFSALCTNEQLTSVLFEFVRADETGEERVFHTLKLVNAVVTEVEHYIEDTSGSSDVAELERVSFTFQRIEIANVDGGTLAVDDVRQR